MILTDGGRDVRHRMAEQRSLKGVALSPGKALGRVCLFGRGSHNVVELERVDAEAAPRERARLQAALQEVLERLGTLETAIRERVGGPEAEIVAAHRMILEDRGLRAELDQAIGSGFSAESAVAQVLGERERRLTEVGDSILSERAGDLGELKVRLLDALTETGAGYACARQPWCRRGRGRVVVAEELTPALALEADADQILAFVVERGSATSHGAILARALRKPVVSGLAEVRESLACGTEVLVDGFEGSVTLWPDAEARSTARVQQRAEPEKAGARVPGLTVMASISTASEVGGALAVDAEGVGLYRTEYEMLAAGRILDETEQLARYRHVLETMGGRPVVVRLLDLGNDKRVRGLDLPRERNPALGLRGARLLLQRPDLLVPQARALARASVLAPVRVLYPMIVEQEQFVLLRRRVEEAVREISGRQLQHGVLIEVPSACLDARGLFEAADFASVGTNDLFQFLFAVDREGQHRAEDCSPDRPLVWALLAELARIARETSTPLAVCGEVASEPRYLRRLVEMGVGTVSVAPSQVSLVREAARPSLSR